MLFCHKIHTRCLHVGTRAYKGIFFFSRKMSEHDERNFLLRFVYFRIEEGRERGTSATCCKYADGGIHYVQHHQPIEMIRSWSVQQTRLKQSRTQLLITHEIMQQRQGSTYTVNDVLFTKETV